MKLLPFLLIFITQYAVAESVPIFFDNALNDLLLNDVKSGKRALSDMSSSCKGTIFPTYCFLNQDGTQKAILFFHPGSNKYEVAEISVLNAKPSEKYKKYPGQVGEFVTSKGIKLGISPSDLILKIGKPTKKDGDIYLYREEFNKFILDTYNVPIYHGKYIFKNEKLVEFMFGFEYP